MNEQMTKRQRKATIKAVEGLRKAFVGVGRIEDAKSASRHLELLKNLTTNE
jgi:hypothetical protein